MHWPVKPHPSGCLVWTGTRSDSTPLVYVNGRRKAAHVVAWEAKHGPLPKGHRVAHTCGDPLCVAIDHLTRYDPSDPRARFMRHVRPDRGHWEWIGAKAGGASGRDYGRFQLDGKSWPAHRASWLLWQGTIPEGMQVRRTCLYPGCVNPDHLRLFAWGTHDHAL